MSAVRPNPKRKKNGPQVPPLWYEHCVKPYLGIQASAWESETLSIGSPLWHGALAALQEKALPVPAVKAKVTG